MMGELFQYKADLDLVNVPYKGSAPALVDVVGGRIDVMFDGIPSSLPLAKNGQVRILGATGTSRSSVLPDTPIIAEVIPDFDASGWFAIFAPTGIDEEKVAVLNKAINNVLELDEIQKRYLEFGAETVVNGQLN